MNDDITCITLELYGTEEKIKQHDIVFGFLSPLDNQHLIINDISDDYFAIDFDEFVAETSRSFVDPEIAIGWAVKLRAFADKLEEKVRSGEK